jgi:hypothetical protein
VVVAGGAELVDRELLVLELELLQASDVGTLASQPGKDALLARTQGVDVVGGDPHARRG